MGWMTDKTFDSRYAQSAVGLTLFLIQWRAVQLSIHLYPVPN